MSETARLILALFGGILIGYIAGNVVSYLDKSYRMSVQSNLIEDLRKKIAAHIEVESKQQDIINLQRRKLKVAQDAWTGMVHWLASRDITIEDDAGVIESLKEGGEADAE